MNSIWTQNAQLSDFRKLEKDIKTDVLIIGGGITGILCGYMLRKAGIDCVIAEAAKIGSGTTKNTTAKLTLQHGLIYSSLLKSLGKEKTLMYLKANYAALEEYKKLCTEIDCDFETKDSFVYSLSNRNILEAEVTALEALNFKAEYVSRIPLPIQTAA